jgi:hypothetical protein
MSKGSLTNALARAGRNVPKRLVGNGCKEEPFWRRVHRLKIAFLPGPGQTKGGKADQDRAIVDNFVLKSGPSQPQGIGNYRYGAEGHGQAGHHRV